MLVQFGWQIIAVCQRGQSMFDRIPSTNPGADPPRDVRDSGSARLHSMHLERSTVNGHLHGDSDGTKMYVR